MVSFHRISKLSLTKHMVNLGTDLDYILLFVGIIGNSSEINGED
jgi:hypothetical protein